MKVFLLISFILSLLSLEAQSFRNIPTDNARWINRTDQPMISSNPVILDAFCLNGEDTTINNFIYTKVKFCDTQGYFAAIRNDHGKCFIVCKDSTYEHILYDFTLQAGDSIDSVVAYGNNYEPSFEMSLFVSQVWDTPLTLDGVTYDTIKYIYFDNGLVWFEGIGSSGGLFRSHGIRPDGGDFLACHNVNDTTFYCEVQGPCSGYIETGGCDEVALDIQEKLNIDFIVYPNPCIDKLYLDLHQFDELKVLDLYGRVQQVDWVSNGLLDVSKLRKGVYCIQVLSKGGVKSSTFVKG